MRGGLRFGGELRELEVGPPLNKKVFPVHRPGGLKGADWDFFS